MQPNPVKYSLRIRSKLLLKKRSKQPGTPGVEAASEALEPVAVDSSASKKKNLIP